jgi:transposase InsO family protein
MHDNSHLLTQIYYNPQYGFKRASELFREIKNQYPQTTIKLKDCILFLKCQKSEQLHKPVRSPKHYLQIKARKKDENWQADLLEFPDKQNNNGGNYYLLTIVDVYTRYAWVRPLQDKSGTTVLKAFQEIYIERPLQSSLTTDKGKEFQNMMMNQFLDMYHIRLYIAEPGDHNILGIINRFHRTLRNLIEKYKTAMNTEVWINALPSLVLNYNNAVHTTLKMSPFNASQNSDAVKVKEQNKHAINAYKKIHIGDHVRVKVAKGKFGKESKETYSKQIYTVAGIQGYSFALKNEKGTILQRYYKYYNLSIVESVEKVPSNILKLEQLRNSYSVVPYNRKRNF